MKTPIIAALVVAVGICIAAPVRSPAASGPMEAVGIVGDYLNDAGTTAEVKARILAEKGMEGAEISVTTNNAIVVLEGVVANTAQSALAERIARGLSNVKGVTNKLKVK
ncbi:BON domain-containing protein [Desulfovibrio sp. OttesenSCG-928-O18]|nr:BON domain-containing protein [Desulfovibrio sp. OttesenSCG-928-O18]